MLTSMEAVDWTFHIPIPEKEVSHTQQLMGETLTLQGGIEMKYITPPVICFPKLEHDEMDWMNRSPHVAQGYSTPLLRSPVVSYRNVKEGWEVTRWNPTHHAGPNPIRDLAHMTIIQKDAVFLKIFVAAAAVGDITALYSEWDPAREYSIQQKLEGVFCKAANKLLGQLLRLLMTCDDEGVVPPHQQTFAKMQESFFLNEIASVSQSQASWMGRRKGQEKAAEAALQSAARCACQAARRTHEFVPHEGIRFDRYCNLGVMLLLLGLSEMAKRAFLWSLTDPVAWINHRTNPEQGQIHYLLSLWIMCNDVKDDDERRKILQKVMKAQRARVKKTLSGHYHFSCPFCKKRFTKNRLTETHCARCCTPYCSEDCYRNDWPQHKKTCKQIADANSDDYNEEGMTSDVSTTYEKYGICTDATQERLSLWVNTKFFMSLTESSERADAWKGTKPKSISLDIPMWLLLRIEPHLRSELEPGDCDDDDDDWSPILTSFDDDGDNHD